MAMAGGPERRRAVLLGRRDGTCAMMHRARLLLQESPECYLALRP